AKVFVVFFFFQAEDGIRDYKVTGVQTCALPISRMPRRSDSRTRMVQAAFELFRKRGYHATAFSDVVRESGAPRGSIYFHFPGGRSEERRVGKECRSRGSPSLLKKDKKIEGCRWR